MRSAPAARVRLTGPAAGEPATVCDCLLIETDTYGLILTDTGLGAADAGQLPGLTGFVLHLLRDLDAVTAGLTPHWSSGSIEGAINRIKKIKRQLCGRAGFDLLRKMIPLQ
ncbi:hypothetical protein ACFRFJ_08000 [Streptomyces hydrogenans]|uniref:hypothetical protein n=1 Tax=Streptomyces hydrogenans TaxID=1873719 RepID=UPI0036A285AA